jgi:hypothetical protein
MSQIEINILKEGFKSNKILSVSFFTMNDPYRDFTKYQKYLERFISHASHLPEFQIRIYTDDTGKDFALEVSQGNDQVSVYHFNCPDFRDPQGIGHIGVFGPIVRFLPLFEAHDTVWISDIDVRDNFLDEKYIKPKYDFSISTYPYYFRKAFNQKYTIIAHRIISRIQLPRALLTRFLTKLAKGNLQKETDLLNLENGRKPKSSVPYCTDELFLNTSVYTYLKNHPFKIQIELDKILIGLIPNAMKNLTRNEELSFYRYSLDKSETNTQNVRRVYGKILQQYGELYPVLKTIDLKKLEESFSIKSSEL